MDSVAESIISRIVEGLWLGAIAATPVGLLVAGVCGLKRLGPATRHLLWSAVLLSFITPAIAGVVWRPRWFAATPVATVAATPPPAAPVATRAPVSATPLPPTAPIHTALLESPRPWGETSARDDGSFVAHTLGFSETLPPTLVSSESVPLTPGCCDSPCESPATALPRCIDSAEPEWAPLDTPRRVDPLPRDRDADIFVLGGCQLPPPVSSPSQTDVLPAHILADTNSAKPESAMTDAAATERAESKPAPLPPAWLVPVLRARDAIADAPVPASIWFGGAAAFALVGIARSIAAGRWVRDGRPADAELVTLVRQVADTLGLSRPPQTIFVDRGVSPMIWCGLRAKLVIPTGLWATLDHDGRRAVVVHELAHLRRWDHVFCWVQAAIAAVYWWHPVAWWANRRASDEAEASCDAWVTSLFPSGRRAYASVLVVSKSYLSHGRGCGAGLGIASGSAKKLARRITMVMTQRSAPKLSLFGGCAAALVLTLGAFVTPGLACPPEETKPAKAVSAPRAAASPKAKVKVAKPAKAPKPGQNEPEIRFFGEAPALDAMRTLERFQPGGMGVLRDPNDHESLKVGRELREYELPDGKLEAFFDFMSRSDVPILVERRDGGIGIWANEHEHQMFKAFFSMVHPEGHSLLNGQQLRLEGRALAELGAARAALGMHGQALAVVGAAHDLRAEGVARAGQAQHYRAEVQRMMAARAAMEADTDRAREEAEKTRERAEQIRELAEELRERSVDLGSGEERAALEDAMSKLRTRAETIHGHSRGIDERVARLEAQIRDLEAQLEQREAELEAIQEAEEDAEDTEEDADDDTTFDLTLPSIRLDVLPRVNLVSVTVPTPAVAPVPGVPATCTTPCATPTPCTAPVAPIAPTPPTPPAPAAAPRR